MEMRRGRDGAVGGDLAEEGEDGGLGDAVEALELSGRAVVGALRGGVGGGGGGEGSRER